MARDSIRRLRPRRSGPIRVETASRVRSVLRAGSSAQRLVGHDHATGAASSSMKASALRRVGRVERHVGAAGLEDCRAAPTTSSSERSQADADQRVRARRPAAAAVRRELVRRGVELAVGQRCSPSRDSGDRVGRPLGLRLEELVDGTGAGSPRAVSFQSTSSCRRLRRRCRIGSSRAASSGCGGDAARAASRSGRASARSWRASNRSVLYSTQPPRPVRAPRRRDSVRSNFAVALDVQRLRSRRPASSQRLRGAFCRTNITWKSGLRLEVALRLQLLDQLLERHVLVGVGAERDLAARAPSSSRKRRVARQVGAQHQRVDEEADQPLGLRRGAAGDRRADHDVVLPGVAAQAARWNAASSVMNSVAPSLPAERLQRVGAAPAADRPRRRAPVALHARARPVGRQLQRRPAPASCCASTRAAVEASPGSQRALPDGEVGVLDRQLRQRRRPARRGTAVVERASSRMRIADRPAVGDDVVHDEQQHVVVRRRGAAACARSSGPAREVERPPRLVASSARRLRSRARSAAGPRGRSSRQVERRLGDDPGPAGRPRSAKRGAQRLVPRDDLVERARAARPRRARRGGAARAGCCSAGARLELVEEPEPLLRRTTAARARSRPRGSPARSSRPCLLASPSSSSRSARRASRARIVVPTGPRSRRILRSFGAASSPPECGPVLSDRGGDGLDGRRLESAERELDPEGVADPETRVARSEWPPRSKKLSWTPTRARPALGPHGGDHSSIGRARRDVLIRRPRRSGPARAAPAIDLAVGGQRQGVEDTNAAGTMYSGSSP